MALMTEFDEGSRGGDRSIMAFAAAAAVCTIFVLAFALDVFHLSGQRSVATPPQTTEAPATQPATQP
jgi:hypothetical protein